ncbi:hypothetical protein ABMA70_12720 [Halobacteriovorax sp. XZX-3]|uniref:hypothetical protein n=1 Tax=unclassified Halobacteriovorax TaxID=2639665 RepID=UPI000CD29682|nr:hypothetical protein [Halobacteriovorax sp. DA5]POB12494.1 hypothetical protein C0Z22_15170 [Halobacteriovorax sp. DA5]
MRLLSDRTNLRTNSTTATKKVGRSNAAADLPVASKSTGGQSIVRRERPSELSRGEIKAKIENHKREKEEKMKAAIAEHKATKQGQAVQKASSPVEKKAQAIKEATKAEVKITPEGEPFGDIAKNDPKDPATQEKLKGVLTAGAFNFSDKERDVLAKILNQ